MKKIYIYSHTHWDREWYLSQTQFQYRLIRTIDEIMELIDAEDGFDVFVMDGQTCVIQDYLELRPERAGDIRRLIAAGKLVIGPWYSMPDDFLADGESLIRNLMRGHADCGDYGAPYPNVGYVPDSFGHIEQMPQILRGVGIDNFVFGRGRPVAMATGKGHKQEFTWRAPDGTEVLAFNPPGAYNNAMFLPGADEPEALRKKFEGIVASFEPSHRPDLALAAHGIDHTWLQRDIAAILKALPGIMPEVEFHHGTIADFIEAWKSAPPAELETWSGQLRGRLVQWELHGTLSSRIDNKLWNARAATYLQALAEPLDAIVGRYGKADARPFLRKAWELMFQNHAHDSICGCSQDRVHDEVNARFLKVAELGTDVADSALDFLNQAARQRNEAGAIVYAGLNAGHTVVAFVVRLAEPPPRNFVLLEADGTARRVQVDAVEAMRIQHTNASVDCYEARGVVHLPDLVPGEVRRLSMGTAKVAPPKDRVRVRGRVLENGRLRVEVQADGTLGLHDPRTGQTVRGTHYFAQDADVGGGYHFEPLAGATRCDTRGAKARVRRLSAGPLRGALEVRTTLKVPARFERAKRKRTGRATLTFTSVLTLDAESEVLKVRTTVDNAASHQRIRVVLPTGMATTTVHADASFAVHDNAPDRWPADPGLNFHPMRSFVDIAEGAGGMAFMGQGHHEYEIVPTDAGTDLEVTLLRSVDFVFLCCTWETPGAQQHGSLTHDYALRLHAGDWRNGLVAESAAAHLNPAVCNVNGDSQHPHEDQGHATVGFYAKRGEVEVPVDANRSTWHATNAHRDGWRRLEADRFTDRSIPARIVPWVIDGDHMIVSAFKRAEDGRGEILRFWSAAATAQTVTVRTANTTARLSQVDLLERRSGESELAGGGEPVGALALTVRPFQVVSVRIEA